jgi:ribosomal protein S27AE
MERFMPRSAAQRTAALAEAVALERAKSQPISMCTKCGVTATEASPVKCGVCGATTFETISREMIERIAAVEGALEEETTYDGRKLKWTEEAKKALWTMKDAYQRRRTKARVEKSARMKKMDVVTLEFAKKIVEEETGTPLEVGTVPASQGTVPSDSEKKLIARDAKNVPLVSSFDWNDDAAQRALRIPAGFMRNRTQDRIEAIAAERSMTTIDLALVEEGIEYGKKAMAEMLASQAAQTPHTGLNEVGTITALGVERKELGEG